MKIKYKNKSVIYIRKPLTEKIFRAIRNSLEGYVLKNVRLLHLRELLIELSKDYQRNKTIYHDITIPQIGLITLGAITFFPLSPLFLGWTFGILMIYRKSSARVENDVKIEGFLTNIFKEDVLAILESYREEWIHRQAFPYWKVQLFTFWYAIDFIRGQLMSKIQNYMASEEKAKSIEN